jgi:hypothetical protein
MLRVGFPRDPQPSSCVRTKTPDRASWQGQADKPNFKRQFRRLLGDRDVLRLTASLRRRCVALGVGAPPACARAIAAPRRTAISTLLILPIRKTGQQSAAGQFMRSSWACQ